MPEPIAPVTPVTPVAPVTPEPAWHGATDPTETAYIQNKGWASPADVIKSYKGAEQLIGRDPNTLLQMPKPDDAAGLRAVYARLGMPATADKYEFDTPADMALDEGYVNWARENFHKAGLTAAQAKAITTEHNAYIKGVMAKQEADYNLSVQADKTALLQEWGGGHERMMNAAKTAASTLGFTPEMVDAMEKSVGYASTMKFFAQLGQKLGEDKFVTPGDGPKRFGDTLTPSEAKAQWDAATLDPAFTAALRDKQHPGHKAAAAKQTQLFAVMYPEK